MFILKQQLDCSISIDLALDKSNYCKIMTSRRQQSCSCFMLNVGRGNRNWRWKKQLISSSDLAEPERAYSTISSLVLNPVCDMFKHLLKVELFLLEGCEQC